MQRWLLPTAALSIVAVDAGVARADEPAAMWVFFADKAVVDTFDRALDERASTLSSKALQRRRRARGDRGVDPRDLDLSPEYVAAVAATGARLRASSRWLDAVSVVADAQQRAAVAALPFVTRMQPVGRRARVSPGAERPRAPRSIPRGDDPGRVYGLAAEQLGMLGVPDMHDCGLSGAGVIVAVLDSGFTLGHEALSHVDVLAQRDFVRGDEVTADEQNDVPGQHDHGTSVLSLLAGRAPGTFMGVAPEVTLILAKTEDVASEQPIEEDWFVAGLEWAEGLGADVATASLGYIDWYEPADLDGMTAVTTIAANVAIENGLVMVASAGNSGPSPTSIGAPADADQLIAVGAVDLAGQVTEFSSRGPTFDGRIKPDVSALGLADFVVVPGTVDQYQQGNGTSFAAPLVAGVAALLKQAYPDLDGAQMHALLTSTATHASLPDNDTGYGIVRGYEAAGLYCTCRDVDEDGAFDAACGGTDCDDRVADVAPQAPEQCNGRDDDCDGALGPGEEDEDGDGALACDVDCDDTDPSISSDAVEDCGDGMDNDCDAAIDAEDADCVPVAADEPPDAASAVEPQGCGCHLPGKRPGGAAALLWLWAALLCRLRRRASR